jgi:hypothetical protein
VLLRLLSDRVLAFSDVSQVIYARVPDSLKEAAETYSGDRGVTLTSAVVDLVERGLAAVTDEKSINDLEKKMARVTAEKAKVEAEHKTAQSELATLRAFATRASQKIGRCPNPTCGRDITGIDLLAVGQCRHCGQALSELLAPATQTSTLDQREFGFLVGALGAVLVAAAIVGTTGK